MRITESGQTRIGERQAAVMMNHKLYLFKSDELTTLKALLTERDVDTAVSVLQHGVFSHRDSLRVKLEVEKFAELLLEKGILILE